MAEKSSSLQRSTRFGRALVLHGGGSAGNAWEIGVIAGLLDGGIDVREAELIVGTSAGATAAAQITAVSPSELLAAIVSRVPSNRTGTNGSGRSAEINASGRSGAPAGRRVDGSRSDSGELPGVRDSLGTGRPPGSGRTSGDAASPRPVVNHMELTAQIIATSIDPADMRRRMGAAALEADAVGDGSAQARWRETVVSRLPSQSWPARRLLITGVDADTGEPVVFNRDSGVELVDAVAASCTNGFGVPPYPIGDRRYIDGGYRRNENADLAVGHARVLVLSPFGGRSRHPAQWGMQLAAQIDELRSGGSRVETIFPDDASLAAFGPNMMNPASRPPAARAGYEQGRVEGIRLAPFWNPVPSDSGDNGGGPHPHRGGTLHYAHNTSSNPGHAHE